MGDLILSDSLSDVPETGGIFLIAALVYYAKIIIVYYICIVDDNTETALIRLC